MGSNAVDTNLSIEIDRYVTIGEINALKTTLSASLVSNSTVVIQAKHVQTIDSAGLQLFVAFANTLKGLNSSLQWQDPSRELLEAAELLGLAEALGLESRLEEEKEEEKEEDDLLPVF
ncbi:MAG: STAS domain-containing protein [Pseudomonadota bacterium]